MEQTVKPRSGKTSSGRRERRFFRQYQRLEIVLLVSLVSFGIARPSSAAIEFAPVAPLAGTQASTDGDTNDYSPDIKTDGTGTWLAVWPQGPGGGLGITGGAAPVYVRSTDDGLTWSVPVLLRPEEADNSSGDAPAIATDRHGKWLVVWGKNLGELRRSESIDNGESWAPPQVVVSTSNLSGGPSLAADGSGTWVVAWQTLDTLGGTIDDDGDILFSRSVDNGATWSPPAPLNTDAAGDVYTDGEVSLSAGGDGTWVAVWSSYARAWYARSVDNGATWSSRTALGHVGSSGSARPDVATDRNGNWTAVWSVNEGLVQPDLDIWVSHSQDDGASWAAESRLHPYMTSDSRPDEVPRIAALGNGLWTVVWNTSDDLERTIGNDNDTAVSTSRDNGVSWSAPAAVSTVARRDGDAFDFSPRLDSSATGNTVVIWRSDNSLGDTIG